MKKEKKSFRLSDADLDIIKGQKGKTDTERLHNLLKAERTRKEKEIVGRALDTTQKEAFDFENYYCDCAFGTYFKEKRMVYCRCHYDSVKKWLPRNRLVDPRVCDDHLPTIQNIQAFIANQTKEKRETNNVKRKGSRVPARFNGSAFDLQGQGIL